MSYSFLPYRSPEQRKREHEEILAYIAAEEAKQKQEQEAESEEDAELRAIQEWFESIPLENFPESVRPKPRFEDSLKASDFADKSISPFSHNPYYQINIRHPAIAPLYEQFVRECKTALPISDAQRNLFEMRIIHKLDSLKIFKWDYEKPLTDEEIRKLKYDAIFESEKRAEREKWKEMSGR